MKKKLRPQGQDEEAFLEDMRSNVEFRHGLLPLNSSSSKGELASTTDKGHGPHGLINQWRRSHDLDDFKKPGTLQRGSRPHVLMEPGRRDELKLSVKRVDDAQQDDAGSRAASMGHVTIKLKLPVRTCSDKEGMTEAAITGNGIGQWSGENSDSRGMVLDNDDDSCSDNLHEDSSSLNWQTENLKTEACDTTNYYLRHKVSQWHLKASRMEADISESRFRHQYKRFPVLSGFNKGKRSCRRKLVGHLKRRLAILSGSLTYLTGKARQGGKCALLLKSSVHDSYPQLQNDVSRRQPRKPHYWDGEELTDCFGRTNRLMLACTNDGYYRDFKSQNWMGKFYMSSSSPSIASLQNSHSANEDTGGKKENGSAPAVSVPASNVPSCQVQGCKNDLSCARDYYKRRKICEWHSKASKVNVDNIEQRFCQQCSRFQILSEFDEGRRSCRKMLAGHNERRRKPPSKSRVISRKSRHGDSNISKTLQVYVRRKKRFLDAPLNSQVEKSMLEEMQLDED